MINIKEWAPQVSNHKISYLDRKNSKKLKRSFSLDGDESEAEGKEEIEKRLDHDR